MNDINEYELDHWQYDKIIDLLIGRKVVGVDRGTLTLDNGTDIIVVPNEGGCSCGSGDYYLDALNRVDNVITKVEFDYDPEDTNTDRTLNIFVYAENERVNLMTVSGDDGDGYYGTGFILRVREPKV